MNTSRLGTFAGALAVAACVAAPPAPPPDTRAAEEATIRTLIKAWSAASQAKDAEKFLSAYAPDGAVLLANAPDMRGLAALREGIPAMMQDPSFALSFEADKVVVARSADLAYETGAYRLTMSGPDKKPATERGHYVVVWQKQPDGAWKVVIDAPVSDPPDRPAAGQP